ncbi:M15 family metallopeptidase [Leptospira idonii]|uniref:D-alanyl-D-alanine carboxypeptidase family protein n=1 Tax=Leptospira idonii TaxID=1193500 RepID=A0A4R9M042_9LEPT|nr:M15 family metallopeptidase [Leptospira idonii]TGN19135.1 D-alanyl-D-alanine carboxypeptidase family protein [Leptospira idonii]
MSKLVFFSILLLFLFCTDEPVQSQSKQDPNLYLGLDKIVYLTGKFNASQVLSETNLEESSKDHYLRPEARKALFRMIDDFEETKPSHYKQHIFLVSSFRNFNHQKGIWESKYTGKKQMRVPVKGKTPSEIVSLILEFSSAPGTSRHHWGTDFDLNSLENSYFEKSGKGKVLYDWLIENAARYGFCQPYNEFSKRNFKGYQEEKWHWSYAPISNQLTAEWVKSFKEGKINLKDSFLGGDVLGETALDYVQSINQDCYKIK